MFLTIDMKFLIDFIIHCFVMSSSYEGFELSQVKDTIYDSELCLLCFLEENTFTKDRISDGFIHEIQKFTFSIQFFFTIKEQMC